MEELRRKHLTNPTFPSIETLLAQAENQINVRLSIPAKPSCLGFVGSVCVSAESRLGAVQSLDLLSE